MSKKPYVILTIFFVLVVVCSVVLWFSPHSFGGDLFLYIALLSSVFASITAYNYWDICYLEIQGEEELRTRMSESGYREIINHSVCPIIYTEKGTNKKEAEFNIVLPPSTVVRIKTPLAEIIFLNRRYTSFRYRCYDLVYDGLSDEFLLFTNS